MAAEQGLKAGLGHRERKKRQTRRAIVDAALSLFQDKGYEQTTVAEIASAAGIAPRTFFSYFETKEDVLFDDSRARLELGLSLLAEPWAGETVESAATRIVETIARLDDPETDFSSGPVQVRLAAVATVPAVQARAMWWLMNAQQRLAEGLHAAFPDRLDETGAAAVIGALVGAMVQTVIVSVGRGDSREQIIAEFRRASMVAINGIAAPLPASVAE